MNGGFYGPAPKDSEYDPIGRYYSADLGVSGVHKNWKYVVDFGRRRNEGHREKSAFAINHVYGKAIHQPNSRDTWIFTSNYNKIRNDAPATWFNSRLAYQVAEHRKDDFQEKEEYGFDVNYKGVKSTNIKYDGRIYYYRNYSYFSFNDDPENSTPSNINFGKQTVDEEFVFTRRIGGAFQTDYHHDKHYIVGGFDAKFDYVNGIPDTVLYGEHRTTSAGIYIQDEIQWSEALITTLGLRYDLFHLRNALDESNVSPKLALTYQVNPQVSVRALFSRAFRNPSIAERFIKFEQGGGA